MSWVYLFSRISFYWRMLLCCCYCHQWWMWWCYHGYLSEPVCLLIPSSRTCLSDIWFPCQWMATKNEVTGINHCLLSCGWYCLFSLWIQHCTVTDASDFLNSSDDSCCMCLCLCLPRCSHFHCCQLSSSTRVWCSLLLSGSADIWEQWPFLVSGQFV